MLNILILWSLSLPTNESGLSSTMVSDACRHEHAKTYRNKQLYDTVARKFGPYFVPVVERIHPMEIPHHLIPCVNSYDLLDGITELGNPCINAKQGAAWLEDNDFKACPVLNDTSMEALNAFYIKHHRITLSVADWRETLIRIAIPYAKERLLIIAPSNYKISDKIVNEAKRRNICVDKVPLTFFTPSRVDEMRKRIMVHAKDPDGFEYPPEVEKSIGQKYDKYFDLLPVYMQNQLRNNKNIIQ